MKRRISKIKLLQKQLRNAQQQAELEKQELKNIALAKHCELETLKRRFESIGAPRVDQSQENNRFTIAIVVDPRKIGNLANPGGYLVDLAGQLMRKMVDAIPELRGPMPETFLQNLRTLPDDRRRQRLMPLFTALRQQACRDYDHEAVYLNSQEVGMRHCDKADVAEIHEALNHTIGFHAFCHLLNMLEQHAHLIRP